MSKHIEVMQKKVLITGANSFIGTSFEKYANENYADIFSIDTIDTKDGSWREKDFGCYDVVFHVAGIAHADVGKVTHEIKAKYYEVNTKLAIETAKKAKKDGVGQFVFMSSMIVYGKQERITKDTKPHPSNFYGDSKWKADKGVRRLASDDYTVTVLRPPMIYGKGSKGNYPKLSKLAKMVPIFPDYDNKRSMLYIENLCEFLCQVMIQGRDGIFFPQNKEYASTSQIVREVAHISNHKVLITKALNPAVTIVKRFPVKKIRDMANKAFGDSGYEMGMSEYDGIYYQQVSSKDSIIKTECLNRTYRDDKSSKPYSNSYSQLKFSIITICYNSGNDIARTIESVLNQDYKGLVEYLIIDGASTDSTVAVAERYRLKFKKRGYDYHIVSEPDKGIYDAMNKGIKKSTGNIIGIINSGDWYEKQALSTAAKTYNVNPFDMFYADINLVKKDGRIIVKHSKQDKIVTSRHWNHPTSFVTRATYDELGLYRCEGIHDDFEFLLRVKKANKKIVIRNVVLANFMTGGASNQKSLGKSVMRIKDRYKAYKVNKYGSLYLVECIGIEVAKAIIC